MTSEKPKLFFEPVSILAGSRVEDPMEKVSEEENLALQTRSELTTEYFFKKIVAENAENFEALNIQNEILSVVTKAYGAVSLRLREKLSSLISPEMVGALLNLPVEPDSMMLRRTFRPTIGLLYVHKKSPTLIIPTAGSTFYVISNEAKHVKALVNDIKSQSDSLSKITRDFGLELVKFMTSKDYQTFSLEKIENIAKVEYGEPKNTFEKEVIDVISDVTTSFLSNMVVRFKEPNESFEYDIFTSFQGNRFVIEPTDYSFIKEEINSDKIAPETLKSKIVLATMDKSQRLKAMGIVVVNGFPDDTFKQLKTIADSRGIILMNEKDYKEKLPSELCRAMLTSFSNPRLIGRVGVGFRGY